MREKGITLIALVITIIVMLILAGISINMLLGENGLIGKAESAVDKYNKSMTNEQILLGEIENYLNETVWEKVEVPEKLVADGSWSDSKQVNTPKLVSGMIPIKYNAEESVWEITTESDTEWYNYKTEADGNTLPNQWANVMLSDGTYKAGSTATVGTKVQESELGSMFVWIPRYAYSITSNYHNGGSWINGAIEVEFLKGVTNTGATGKTSWDNTTGEGKWNIHPAFTNGSTNNYANGGWDTELPGLWVAKFEASSSNPSAEYGGGNVTNLNVKVIPNVTSWRNITIANMFTNCIAMNGSSNIYGASTSDSHYHMMKNSEWGAVAYLTQSKYGRNGEKITINNNSNYITGIAGDTVGARESAEATNTYNTVEGVLASTTANIYGIYDLAGGAFEYVAAGLTSYIDNGTSDTASLSSVSGFSEKLVDRYEGTSGATKTNYKANAVKYGDAVYETSSDSDRSGKSWNSNSSVFPYSPNTFFSRGGYYANASATGVFAFYYNSGSVWRNDRVPPGVCSCTI